MSVMKDSISKKKVETFSNFKPLDAILFRGFYKSFGELLDESDTGAYDRTKKLTPKDKRLYTIKTHLKNDVLFTIVQKYDHYLFYDVETKKEMTGITSFMLTAPLKDGDVIVSGHRYSSAVSFWDPKNNKYDVTIISKLGDHQYQTVNSVFYGQNKLIIAPLEFLRINRRIYV